MTIDNSVDIAVIVTDRAKSALNMEHHQFEYDPPGELVTTRRVIPIVSFSCNDFTTMNPSSGKIPNCKKHPVKIAFLFFIWATSAFISTVADMPKTSAKRSTFPDNVMKSNMFRCVCVD